MGSFVPSAPPLLGGCASGPDPKTRVWGGVSSPLGTPELSVFTPVPISLVERVMRLRSSRPPSLDSANVLREKAGPEAGSPLRQREPELLGPSLEPLKGAFKQMFSSSILPSFSSFPQGGDWFKNIVHYLLKIEHPGFLVNT